MRGGHLVESCSRQARRNSVPDGPSPSKAARSGPMTPHLASPRNPQPAIATDPIPAINATTRCRFIPRWAHSSWYQPPPAATRSRRSGRPTDETPNSSARVRLQRLLERRRRGRLTVGPGEEMLDSTPEPRSIQLRHHGVERLQPLDAPVGPAMVQELIPAAVHRSRDDRTSRL